MTFNIAWLQMDKVIWVSVEDVMTLADIVDIGNEVQKMLDTNDTTDSIYLLLDALNVREYPKELIKIRNIVAQRAHDKRIRMTLHLTNDYFQHHMMQMIAMIFRVRVKSFTTYTDVVRYLNMPEMPDFPTQ